MSAVAEVVVRVHDQNSASDERRHAALSEAAGILAPAVHVRWRVCDEPAAQSACAVPIGRQDRVLRLIWSADPPHAVFPGILGIATIGEGLGGYATVFLDRVEAVANYNRLSSSLVLGRTIAHELAHLLMGTTSHSGAGLMRGGWTNDALRLSLPADWVLTPKEIELIRRRLER